MRAISWNCRGLGSRRATRELRHLIRSKNPKILFLMETKCDVRTIEKLKHNLGWYGIAVSARGRGGGFAMLWCKSIDIQIQAMSRSFIDAIVSDVGTMWRITGFYGDPDVSRRHESWKQLEDLSTRYNLPWVCLGDFNEVLRQKETKGMRPRPAYQIRNFRNALLRSDLVDIRANGYPYTWARNWKVRGSGRARLDRVCVNANMRRVFPNIYVEHLNAIHSDHLPILVSLNVRRRNEFHGGRYRIKDGFKFEYMWLSKAECSRQVEQAWRGTVGGINAVDCLKKKAEQCSKALQSWGKGSFGNIGKEIERLRSEIAKIKFEDQESSEDEISSFNHLYVELEERLDQQEKLWQQRAKEHWLKEGDRNTTFFHGKATEKFKKKEIRGLSDQEGNWCTEEEQIVEMIADYFNNIYTTSAPSMQRMTAVIERFKRSLQEGVNEVLMKPFEETEILKAIKGMKPLKAPGPDGFPPVFYQRFWNIVGKDVVEAIFEMLEQSRKIETVNHTNIVLIPKVPTPKLMTQYRPISLCNVIYRMMSKVLAERLKHVLNDIISPFQSAFVPGRQITDNVLIAHELQHTIKKKRAGKSGFMSIKLDMAKAFDRVEWGFILLILKRIGMHEKFIELIEHCISTVTYSFRINEKMTGFLKPTRGLRQGDPLSPYLFILCAESLSSLLQEAVICGLIKGVKVGKSGPRITHLQFADDIMLFGSATTAEASNLRDILQLYCDVSGQSINKEKSEVVFSPNTPMEERENITILLGIKEVKSHQKYLGLPSVAGRSKREMFEHIKEKIWKKVQGWNEKTLSRAGKEVLIKAVLQAIPSYAMSCFRLPECLVKEIQSIVMNFWWKSGDGHKPIHWVSWETTCLSKRNGGLGFRDLKAFNLALLGKQVWRLVENQNTLLYEVYKAKYFPNSDFWEVMPNVNCSFSWRSIIQAREYIRGGMRWRIGNGNRAKILLDRWLPQSSYIKAIYVSEVFNKDDRVNKLIDASTGRWNESMIKNCFEAEEANAILSVPLSELDRNDIMCWEFTKNRCYNVRSAYHYVKGQLEEDKGQSSTKRMDEHQKGDWQRLWKLNVAGKIKIFLWRACLNSLPSADKLEKRGVNVHMVCPWCETEYEDLRHIFKECHFSRQVWALSLIPHLFLSVEVPGKNAADWIAYQIKNLSLEQAEIFAVVLWCLWSARNKEIFEGRKADPLSVVNFGLKYWRDFKEAQLNKDDSNCSVFMAQNNSWSMPSLGFLKINFDAVVFERRKMCGIGMILRNDQGDFIAAKAMKISFNDAEMSEAIALRKVSEWVKEMRLDNVIVEGDAVNIMTLLSKPEKNYSEVAMIIEDARSELNKVCQWKASWVRRSGNVVAHILAQHIVVLDQDSVSFDNPPDVILSALLADLQK